MKKSTFKKAPHTKGPKELYMRSRYRIIEGPESVQGSPEWLEFRKGKIGASAAPVIMGVSPFQTKLQLWEEIMSDKPKPKNRAMQRGNDLEDKARQWLNARPGLSGQYKPVVLQSICNPKFIASLDGFYENAQGKPHLAEIKCPGIEAHLEALERRIPSYYYPQLQHQMDLAGVDQMIYVSFDGEDGVVIPCYRDKNYCVDLFAAELSFMNSIIDCKPPAAVDRDWIDWHDPEATVLAFRYKELSSLIDELETEKENVRRNLISQVGHPRARIGDLKMQKITRKGSLDVDKILKDYEIKDSEKYRKDPVESWKFTFSSCP